jgi:hypothetical protein
MKTSHSDEFFDYSSLLINIEQKYKELEYKCLHKKYEGYLADIVSIHSNLTLLAIWISENKAKERT